MTILRWVLLTALAIAFLMLAVANWTPVPFRLPDGAVVSVQLPVLLAVAFLAGWLPTWLIHLGTRAQLRRRLTRYEGVAPTAVAPTGASVPPLAPLPSQAQPTIVPPAGA